jgi:alanine racemase
MDLVMIDVTKIDNVHVGDEVVLMGPDANEEISCVELADCAGTITWEIITRIGSRVQRVYV